MWVGQAGGFGGRRGLHGYTDGSRVPELSHRTLWSSQGDASKRSGRLDPTLLNRRVSPLANGSRLHRLGRRRATLPRREFRVRDATDDQPADTLAYFGGAGLIKALHVTTARVPGSVRHQGFGVGRGR